METPVALAVSLMIVAYAVRAVWYRQVLVQHYAKAEVSE
jgi:hypothetical protein